MANAEHSFGGDWTETKLDAVGKYFLAYMNILKSRPYNTIYVDAFAGTGYVDNVATDEIGFPELTSGEGKAYIEGSVIRALQTPTPFGRYLFIDKSKLHVSSLTNLVERFEELKSRIKVVRGDANVILQDLCTKTDWKSNRAVIFLDPYGMQVDWTTLEAIASTNAVDLWYLFPLGVAVNRLLAKDGEVPDSWKRSLNRTFGTDTWYGDFYRTRVDVGLFDSAEVTKKVANFDAISDYFVKRLGEIFEGGVAKNPLWLKNSTGCPLYLLCFATANPNAPAAIKIATHILGTSGKRKKM